MTQLERKRNRYLKNREKRLLQVFQNHRKNLDSPIYVELRKAYCQVYNLRETIRIYQRKLELVKKRLPYWEEKVEVLKIEWKQSKRRQ